MLTGNKQASKQKLAYLFINSTNPVHNELEKNRPRLLL